MKMRGIFLVVMLIGASLASIGGAANASVIPGQVSADCLVPGFDDKCESFSRAFEPAKILAATSDIAVSGDKVFLTGVASPGFGNFNQQDYVTAAFDHATGDLLWSQVFDSGGVDGYNVAGSLEVTPDGSKVFLIGTADGHPVTIAYNASSGARLWSARSAWTTVVGISLFSAIGPDGGSLYTIEDLDAGDPSGFGYRVVSRETSTGVVIWEAGYDVGLTGIEGVTGLVVAPDGSTLYLAGGARSTAGGGGNFEPWADASTVALSTGFGNGAPGSTVSPGAIIWEQRQSQPLAAGMDRPLLALGSGGTRVFVTITSLPLRGQVAPVTPCPNETLTFGIEASTGAVVWADTYLPPSIATGCEWIHPERLVADPTGHGLYLAGPMADEFGEVDFGVVAYDSRAGRPVWRGRYGSYQWDRVMGLALAPDGSRLYVVGSSPKFPVSGMLPNPMMDTVTVAFDTDGGGQLWAARFNSNGTTLHEPTYATEVAVGRDGRVFVASTYWHSVAPRRFAEYGLIAYAGGTT